MAIKLTGQLRVDTRGLPEGYDPHLLYEYRFNKAVKKAEGVEYYLYKYIPHSIIKSFAFAIDPLSGFKTSSGVITPANRFRTRAMHSVLMGPTNKAQMVIYRRTMTQSSIKNYLNIPGLNGPLEEPRVASNTRTEEVFKWQPILPHYFNDTTDRTRLLGSKLGESESFQGLVYSPPRDLSETVTSYGVFDVPTVPRVEPYYASINKGYEVNGISIGPFAAALGPDVVESLRNRERDLMTATMQKQVLPMFKGITPEARNYTLYRNVVELRDIPRGILQLKSTIENYMKLSESLKISDKLSKVVHNFNASLKDIPKEYLSYHFGWKQTIKDINDLLGSPEKVSKQINLLISRNGKASTYRSKRSFQSTDEGVPGFSYVTTGYDRDLEIKSRVDREIQLRMVVNSTFEFPPAAEIRLRKELYLDKLGVFPRFIDIYNLVPWTWLVDWYTGLGTYLEIIENTNRDRSTINWGLLTGVSHAKLTTDLKSSQIDRNYTAFNLVDNAPPHEEVIIRSPRHQSYYTFVYRKRVDVAGILDVSQMSDESTLSTYQKSILGAIFATMIDFKHKPRNLKT